MLSGLVSPVETATSAGDIQYIVVLFSVLSLTAAQGTEQVVIV